MLTMLRKRQPTRAQSLLSLTMLMMAFASVVLGVFFRGRAGSLFIYDYIFEFVAVLCPAVYYLGICSLTEPRGATLRQRQAFVAPLVYILGLSIGAFWLGPRRYEILCHQIRDGEVDWISGDFAWNYMLFWDHYLFFALLLVMGTHLLGMAWHKGNIFSSRFNSFYASSIDAPRIKNRPLGIAAWVFFLAAILAIIAVAFRPFYYKYWLIPLAVIVTVVQYLVGRYIYSLNYDARYLANLVKEKQKYDTL